MIDLPPTDAVTRIACFVGSTTFHLSDQDAIRAYLAKNPAWPRTPGIIVTHASKPLQARMDPRQACTLACLDSLGVHLKGSTVAAQVMFLRNMSAGGERVPICFATVFGGRGETKVVMLEDDAIPF